MSVIYLDGLELLFRVSGGPQPTDEDGIEWICTKLEGWVGSPAPRIRRTDRPAGHGAFRSQSFRAARTISVEFTVTAPDEPTLRAAERRVTALCSNTRLLYSMAVYDPPSANRMALVELDDAVLAKPRTTLSTTFSMQLAAPDPRLHDQPWTITETPLPELGTGGIPAPIPAPAATGIPAGASGSPGTVAVDNHGTAEISPVLELVGPLAAGAQVIAINARTSLTFTEAVPAGRSVWINCDEFTALDLPGRSVLLDQTTYWRRALAIDGPWPVVPPGQRLTFAFRSPTYSLSARLRAHSRAAWW